MINITIKEAVKYLTNEEVEKILTKILKNPQIDLYLRDGFKETHGWEEERRLYLSSYPEKFTDQNWLYYFDRIKDLQPKILQLDSPSITNLQNIKEIESLEEVYFGNIPINRDLSYIPNVDVFIKLLTQISYLPKIQRIGFKCSYTGNFEDNRLAFIGLKRIKQSFPNATGIMLNYCTEFTLELNRNKTTHEYS
jgi:hypothetical protein